MKSMTRGEANDKPASHVHCDAILVHVVGDAALFNLEQLLKSTVRTARMSSGPTLSPEMVPQPEALVQICDNQGWFTHTTSSQSMLLNATYASC